VVLGVAVVGGGCGVENTLGRHAERVNGQAGWRGGGYNNKTDPGG